MVSILRFARYGIKNKVYKIAAIFRNIVKLLYENCAFSTTRLPQKICCLGRQILKEKVFRFPGNFPKCFKPPTHH